MPSIIHQVKSEVDVELEALRPIIEGFRDFSSMLNQNDERASAEMTEVIRKRLTLREELLEGLQNATALLLADNYPGNLDQELPPDVVEKLNFQVATVNAAMGIVKVKAEAASAAIVVESVTPL